MNSERKAFIEAAKKIGINTAMVETPMGFQFKYGSTNDAFKIWQASAQRQGYKLVHVDELSRIIADTSDLDTYNDLKSMIGAVDD